MILALLLVITGSAISASAEEYDNTSGWINVFDYNPTHNRNFESYAGQTRTYVLDMPARMRLFDVDVVMFCNGGFPNLSVLTPNGRIIELTKTPLSANMVRYYGYIYDSNYDELVFLIDDSVSHSGSFISVSASTVVGNNYGEIGSMRFHYPDYDNEIDQTVTMSSASKSAHIATANVYFDDYIIELSCPNWKRYDSIDFVVSFDGVSIDSISASYDSVGIDVDYEYVEAPSSSLVQLVLRMDLTGINRSKASTPKIKITGQTAEAVGLSLVSVRGHLILDDPDPYIHWLSEIHGVLTKYLSNIHDDLTSIGEILNNMSEDLSLKLTTLNSSITSMNTDLANKLITLNASISSMNTNMANMLTTLNTSITSMNTNLAGKLTSIHTAISNMATDLSSKLTGINNNIGFQFGQLQDWLSSGFKSVTDKLDVLINGSQEQQAAAEEFKGNASQQSGKIDSAVSSMDVGKPSSGDLDVSVNTMTGGLNFGPFNTAILTLSSDGIVYRLLIMAVTLMLVSYIFFGKKV